MIKTKSVIEVIIGTRTYQMECATDAPLGEVHDALTQMRLEVIQRIVDLDKPKEEPKVEG